MKVCFLRHAQGTHNAACLLQGPLACESWEHKDAPLTPLGHIQASAVTLPFVPDRVYCSPLRRCIQTIRPALPFATLILHDGLLERQGQHPCNVRGSKTFLHTFDSNLDLRNLPETHSYPFQIRESHESLRLRLTAALTDIYKDAAAAGAASILIVGHCDAFESVLKYRLKNTETYVIEVTPEANPTSGTESAALD